MSNEPHSRKLNTGAAHAPAKSGVPHGGQNQQNGARKINRSSTSVQRPVQSTRSASPTRTAAQSRSTYHVEGQARTTSAQSFHTTSKRKKSKKKNGGCLKSFLIILLVLIGLIGLVVAGVYKWVSSSLAPEEGKGQNIIDQIMNTPNEYKGDVANVLVCGIREGMTDMILYVNFDVANKKINMFQIPRDIYPGEEYKTGGTGKINAVANSNGGMGALVELINKQYKLPIDYYVTIDIESLREVVDVFNGIEVYVPRDMAYKGSVLKKGVRNLKGDALEFFLRNRHGDGYAEGDLARLDMQRYFYQALFERIRTATAWDLAKLTPVALKYIETDMPVSQMISLGVSFLKVDSSNIMMCKAPVYAAAEKYNGQYSIVVAAPQEITELLNTYFRTYGGPVEKLNIPTLPTAGGLHQANVQYMGQLDTQVENQNQ